jgi:glycosyltransferase involved in cell wall biosynthesis
LVVASEYEGDGIVIVEAILAGLPILLLDNRDLRRFGLSEVNYFKSQSDLEMKLKQSMADCEKFRVSPEKIAEYKSDRDLTSVTENWLNILR